MYSFYYSYYFSVIYSLAILIILLYSILCIFIDYSRIVFHLKSSISIGSSSLMWLSISSIAISSNLVLYYILIYSVYFYSYFMSSYSSYYVCVSDSFGNLFLNFLSSTSLHVVESLFELSSSLSLN